MNFQIKQQAVFLSVCSLGLACWWPFFRNSYLGMFFYGGSLGAESTVLLGIVVLGIGAFAAFCFAFSWNMRRISVLMGCVSCCAAFLSLALLHVGGFFASAALALCVSLAASASALGWFFALCRIPWPVSTVVLSASFFLSFCLPYVAHFYGEAAMSAINSALMPVSALCLCAALLLFRLDNLFPEKEEGCEQFISDMREMVVVLLLFLVVGGIFRGYFGQGSLDYSPAAEGEFRYVIALALSGSLIALSLLFSRQRAFFVVLWAVLAFAFLAGLVFLSALSRPADEIWSSVVITARTFMGLLLWMATVCFCRGRGLQAQVRYAVLLLLGSETLCLLLTAIVSPLANGILGGCDPAMVSCVMALVLVAGSFVYLITMVVRGSFGGRPLEEDAANAADSSHIDSGAFSRQDCRSEGIDFALMACDGASPEGRVSGSVDGRKAACRMLAERYDVTEREEEVLYQLSLGHSVKKIADTLFISAGTVQSHVKRIYRKLDCHSRQEVIDLVDKETLERSLAD